MSDDLDPTVEPAEAKIAQLLASVGARPAPSTERMQTARDAIHDAWAAAVAARRQRRQRLTVLGMAASLLLGIGLGWQLLLQAPQTDAPNLRLLHAVALVSWQPAAEDSWRLVDLGADIGVGARLQSGPDSYATLVADDGLQVRLDQGTQVEMLSTGALKLLQGAVYVDAPGDASLSVVTQWGEARDIGTRYEVRIVADDWQVQVRDGRVEMADLEAGVAMVSAGERYRSAGNRFVKETVAPADASWSWTYSAGPRMAIDGVTLTHYLDWWQQESGMTVVFTAAIDEELARQTVLHGSLDGLSLEEGLRVALDSAGFRVVDWQREAVILAR